MIDYLKNNINGFTNHNGYSFDFSHSDLKNYNDDISILDDVNNSEKLIVYHNNKTIALPKKVTLKWIDEKINTDTVFRNFTAQFNDLIEFGGVYATTYGIGYSCGYVLKEKFESDTLRITNHLNSLGLEFYTQLSDAAFVLRFVISTKKENVLKIKGI